MPAPLKKGSLILNISILTGLFATYLAIYIPPSMFWPAAVWSLGYSYVLLLVIVYTLFLLIRRKRIALLFIIGLTLGWPIHKRVLQVHRSETANQNAIKVLSFNVRLFNKYGWKIDTNVREQVLHFLIDEQPDIACFQEFYHLENHEKLATFNHVKNAIGAEYSFFEKFTPVDPGRFFGLAIFSKYPIISSGVVHKDPDLMHKARAIYADIKVQEQIIRVYNMHLVSLRFGPKDYAFLENPTEGGSNQQLEGSKTIIRKIRDAVQKRNEEIQVLSQHIKNSPYPVILGGDMNDPPHSYAYSQLNELLSDAFQQAGLGFGFTHQGKGAMPPFRIDYLFASETLSCVQFNTHNEVLLSDHLPITAEYIIHSAD